MVRFAAGITSRKPHSEHRWTPLLCLSQSDTMPSPKPWLVPFRPQSSGVQYDVLSKPGHSSYICLIKPFSNFFEAYLIVPMARVVLEPIVPSGGTELGEGLADWLAGADVDDDGIAIVIYHNIGWIEVVVRHPKHLQVADTSDNAAKAGVLIQWRRPIGVSNPIPKHVRISLHGQTDDSIFSDQTASRLH